MSQIDETHLPGVGVRREFTTHEGDRVGVIEHRTGRRDVLVYNRHDPDSCRVVMRLTEDDGRTLAELMGVPHVSDEAPEELRQEIASGLVIDWLPIRDNWTCTQCTLASLDLPSQTGALIVAVIRNQRTIPSPGADFQLSPGDTAIVVGAPESIQGAFDLLEGHPANHTASSTQEGPVSAG